MPLQLANPSRVVAEHIRRGENVGVMDDHRNPDNAALVMDPAALKLYAEAGLKDIMLEMDSHSFKRYEQLQDQVRHGTLNRDQVRNIIKREGLYFAYTDQNGRAGQDIDQRADLIYHTAKLNIKLHSYDDLEACAKRAYDSLSDEDRALWPSLNAMVYDMAQVSAGALHVSAEKQEALTRFQELILNERVELNPLIATKTDDHMGQMTAQNLQGRSVLFLYGGGHMIAGNDLDDRITAYTGQPTVKFMTNDPQLRDILQPFVDIRHGAVDVPNYVYDPHTGEVREVRNGVRAAGRQEMQTFAPPVPGAPERTGPGEWCNLDFGNLMRWACSSQVAQGVPNPTPSVQTLPAAPVASDQDRGGSRG